MILAVSAMDEQIKMLFFGAAVLLFALATFGVTTSRINLVAAGLATFAFPFFWDALAAS